jgi:hypothetical protein
MPDDRQHMLDAISSALEEVITPNLTTASAASDLFEAFVFSVVLRAARVGNLIQNWIQNYVSIM